MRGRRIGVLRSRAITSPLQHVITGHSPPIAITPAVRDHLVQARAIGAVVFLSSCSSTPRFLRSFASVVSQSSSSQGMAGVPQQPPMPSAASAGVAAPVVRPTEATKSNGAATKSNGAAPYAGPPGFQGWPQGVSMPSGLAPGFRPPVAFRPPHQQMTRRLHQQQYQQFLGQFLQYPQQAVAPANPQFALSSLCNRV